jgi:2-keto-4-pentenoate hydratase/2-oxohepta-3-ene-1,7-dioic acid hydratase in catechol pathway
MKLVSLVVDGHTRIGRLDQGRIHVLDFAGDMVAYLASDRSAQATGRAYAEEEVKLLAAVPRPGKLLAIAANYQEHIEEGGGQRVDKTKITPRVFMKPSSCVIGPGDAIRLPRISQTVDWELELAIVIGRTAEHVSAEQSTEYVAGYVVFNDISSRSLTIGAHREPRPGNEFFDWLNGKWQNTFAPMGPYLVTTDEVPDPDNLWLKLWVNGALKQNSNTRQMIFNTGELVAFCSSLVTLEPGDVIATGTPSGVGATTGTYLKPGDVVRGEVERLGVLENPVVG